MNSFFLPYIYGYWVYMQRGMNKCRVLQLSDISTWYRTSASTTRSSCSRVPKVGRILDTSTSIIMSLEIYVRSRQS
jgi:hypothetical protein